MRKIILVALLDGADTHARSLSDTDRELARELGEMLVYVGVEPDSEHFLDNGLEIRNEQLQQQSRNGRISPRRF